MLDILLDKDNKFFENSILIHFYKITVNKVDLPLPETPVTEIN